MQLRPFKDIDWNNTEPVIVNYKNEVCLAVYIKIKDYGIKLSKPIFYRMPKSMQKMLKTYVENTVYDFKCKIGQAIMSQLYKVK